eukprot:CAMPEP_0116564278 /NCGR_PEP_ID=MMETSP0397-20121206/13216_1 /TAXON_ID=216820 /ORGANISM="Cyclophora tenuis, Strain ECT3854" /LENGTH=221 /DNA_ID=CAMNT_0004090847 /DNA_START=141 /DNA_END=802 /DNA_ORIENTATION=+
MIANKLGDQLVDTKTKLTEAEEGFMRTKDTLVRERDELVDQLNTRESEMYRMIEVGLSELASSSGNKLAIKGAEGDEKPNLVDQIGKEGVDKVMNLLSNVVTTSTTAISSATQSLRKPEEKQDEKTEMPPDVGEKENQTTTTPPAENASTESKQQPFDWKMIGSGNFIEKLKSSQAGTAILQGIARRTGQEKSPIEDVSIPIVHEDTASHDAVVSTTAVDP